jgi:hypothetical protein
MAPTVYKVKRGQDMHYEQREGASPNGLRNGALDDGLAAHDSTSDNDDKEQNRESNRPCYE